MALFWVKMTIQMMSLSLQMQINVYARIFNRARMRALSFTQRQLARKDCRKVTMQETCAVIDTHKFK